MPDEGPQDPPEVERPAAPLPLGERLREAIELRGWTVGRVVGGGLAPVSYTHLTLPTILLV